MSFKILAILVKFEDRSTKFGTTLPKDTVIPNPMNLNSSAKSGVTWGV